MEKHYCEECRTTVAPSDPEQKMFLGKFYHKRCLKRVQHENAVPIQLKIVWSGTEPLTRRES